MAAGPDGGLVLISSIVLKKEHARIKGADAVVLGDMVLRRTVDALDGRRGGFEVGTCLSS